jgi:glycerophosphoryl diester phosphodiesterase
MSDPVAVVRDGHRTLLKWHRARRRATDPVFTGRRILEGMALGASVEVDLVVHADHGFAVLHEPVLGRETTGQGRVADTSAETLRTLQLRGNDGRPIADRVMLLDDLTALLAGGTLHPDALLQLDYKEDASVLDARTLASFAQSVGPVAGNLILSSGDAESVRLLTETAPGIRVGYDPCDDDAMAELAATSDYATFVRGALAASSAAEMVYLAHPLVLAAADAGTDLIGAFHAGGRLVDVYTIQRADAAARPLVERLLALRADQLTTDDPEGLAAMLA